MSDLFQDIDLLEHFASAVLVLDVCFINRFYRNILASQLMNAQGNLAKGSLAKKFHKLVKLKGCMRDCLVLGNIGFDILYKLLSVLRDIIVDHH